MKFAIFGNTYQPKKSLHALRLFELLKKQGAEICMCREFYQFLTADLKMEVPVDALLEGNDFTADRQADTVWRNEVYCSLSAMTEISRNRLMPSTKLRCSSGTVLL